MACFRRSTYLLRNRPRHCQLRQIKENPEVSIVFDEYDWKDWSNLKAIRIQGTATILNGGDEYRYAHALLKNKYPEYRTKDGGWDYGEIPIIKIKPKSFGRWSDGAWKE